MSTPPREPTEEELREMQAAYEAELKRITVADMVVQTAVSLVNLGGRRLGRVPGAEDERDLEQVRDAIDAVRGLIPVVERRAGPNIGPLRDALSQLQLAYAREAGAGLGAEGPPAAGSEAGGETPQRGGSEPGGAASEGGGADDGPGPAESSGRLWVPGR